MRTLSMAAVISCALESRVRVVGFDGALAQELCRRVHSRRHVYVPAPPHDARVSAGLALTE